MRLTTMGKWGKEELRREKPTQYQCDQIGRLMKVFGHKLCHKNRPKIIDSLAILKRDLF